MHITKTLSTLAISLLTLISPIVGLIALISLAVVMDTLFAIYTTIKLNGWRSYQSTKLFNIVIKTFFYLGSVILAFVVDKHIIHTNLIFGIPLIVSKTLTLFWIYIEVKSIDETSQKHGNEPFYVIIKNLMTKAKEFKKDINDLKD
jgi:hypothetical protein